MTDTTTHGTSCRKATELMERRDLRPLRLRERFGLWMHLRICDACKAYRQQSRMIDRWLEQRGAQLPGPGTQDLEQRILEGLPPRP